MKTKPRNYSKERFDPSTLILLRQIGLGLLLFSFIGALIALVYFGTRLEAVTINNIEVKGGVTIDKENIKNTIETELSGVYLGLIPKRFLYFYPETKIISEVSSVPRLKDLRVTRDGKTIKVSFGEYVPEALWCSATTEDKCLFMDENGFAFALAPVLSGGSLVRYYATGKDVEEKIVPFSQGDFNATKQFIAYLEEIGWFVERVEISDVRDVFYTISQGGELKATLDDDPFKPFDNLQTILNSKEFSHIKPGEFRYIDLRFGSRVFVNEELLSEMATSTATGTDSTATTTAETE